uniref:(northern house mosquito) hypothetical protein n=1 Tax=Culex pipiens TaxID=7175 RepID=A0A8D8FT08_CULPI
MGQQQSRREQRATDIRASLLSYQHDAGYGSVGPWRSEAVHRGVLRNNARRRSEGCCSCCCWVVLLLLVAAFATAWYAWYRAAQAGHQMAVGFPGLEPGRSCANGTAKGTVVQRMNCTLDFYTMFTQKLGQLWYKSGN